MRDTTTATTDSPIRPFSIEVPQGETDELRRRVNATRWPTRELVSDRSQGVQLEVLRSLARYWTTDYDWRPCEARLNALPQFTTEIDGVGIHFIHVESARSRTRPRTAAVRRTRFTSCCRRSPATGSPPSRPSPARTPSASRRRGRS